MAGNQPSWKTDVHRAPTKKWAEAKSYNYEGDDWGGYDEYNEYGTYDEPPTATKPMATATGYRHRGQSISNQNAAQSQGLSHSNSFEADDERRNFSAGHTAMPPAFQGGQSSSQHGQGQPSTQYEAHHEPSQSEQQYDMYQQQQEYDSQEKQTERANRYDDYQEQYQAETQDQSHEQPQEYLSNDRYDPYDDSTRNIASTDRQAPDGFGPEGDEHTGDTRNPSDIQQQRYYATSALPQSPHNHTASMPTNTRTDAQTPSQFPPRKSSLSGSRPLHLPTSPSAQHQSQSSSSRAEVPESPAQTSPPPVQNRSPFIRPADIYKRMEQERSRERERVAAEEARRGSAESTSDHSVGNSSTTHQATESGRRSVDSPSDRPARSNFISPPVPEARANSISPARLEENVSEPQENVYEDVSTPAVMPASAAVRPSLRTIPEQGSEYGLLGFSVSDPVLARAIGANVFGPRPSGVDSLSSDVHGRSNNVALSSESHEDTESTNVVEAGGNPPSLPQLDRLSGFGSDLWGGMSGSTLQRSSLSSVQESPDTTYDQNVEEQSRDLEEPGPKLQHQPSAGFRTAVAHAFDRGAGPRSQASVESRMDRTNESDLSRSNTDSTAGISPIISRFPPGFGRQGQMQEGDEPTTIHPRMAEELEEPSMDETRPLSSSTLREQTSGFAGNHSRDPSAGSISSGYQRKLDIPSPGNSPARTPAIETEAHLPRASSGYVESSGAPSWRDEPNETTEPELPDLQGSSLATREADLADAVNAHSDAHVPGAGDAAQQAQTDFMRSRHESDAATNRLVESLTNVETTPSVRAGSPSKSRVRTLAEKYDDLNLSRQNTAQSPTGSMASWTSNRKRSPSPSKRNIGDPTTSDQERGYDDGYDGNIDRHEPTRAHSYGRPHLPGEWVSYADTPGSSRQSYAEEDDDDDYDEEVPKHLGTSEGHYSHTGRQNLSAERPSSEEVDLTPNTKKRPLDGKTLDSSETDPMTALAAAGSAMAASIMSSIGLTSPTSRTSPPSESESESNDSWNSSDDERTPGAAAHVPVGDASQTEMRHGWHDDSPAEMATTEKKTTEDASSKHLDAETERLSSETVHSRNASMGQPQRMEIPVRAVQPSFGSVMSVESSPDDTENDRLSKQIVRSLSPNSFGVDADSQGRSRVSQIPNNQRYSAYDSRESTLLPREYDSYWADKANEQSGSEMTNSQTQTSTEHVMAEEIEDQESDGEANHSLRPERTITPSKALRREDDHDPPAPSRSQPGLLGKRFSFEKTEEVEPFSQSFDDIVSPLEPTDTTTMQSFRGDPAKQSLEDDPEVRNASSPVQHGRFDLSSLSKGGALTREGHDQSTPRSRPTTDFKATPASVEADSSMAPLHTEETMAASTNSRFDQTTAEPRFPGVYRGLDVPLLPPIDFSSGSSRNRISAQQGSVELQRPIGSDHVDLPELPPQNHSKQASVDATSDQRQPRNMPDTPVARDVSERFSPNFDSGEITLGNKGILLRKASDSLAAPSEAKPDSHQRLTPFKEISTTKHSSDRTRMFQDTREGFANMDTGLNDWLAYMVKSNPDLAHIEPLPNRSTGGRTGTVLHKISPSVAKFTRSNTSGGPTPQQPYYQQYLDSAAMLPGQGSGDASSAVTSEEQQKTGRAPSVTGQSKGKDILHSAGLLGGRATSSAKGFFSKSKNKFKGNSSDKNSTPSSTPHSTEQLQLQGDAGGPPAPPGPAFPSTNTRTSTRSTDVAQHLELELDKDQSHHGRATLVPSQIEQPDVLIGTAISGNPDDIPAGYGAAQLAPSVAVLPNDNSWSPTSLHGRPELDGTSSDAHPSLTNTARDTSSSQGFHASELDSVTSTASRRRIGHQIPPQTAELGGTQINLAIDSPNETATAGMTKYIWPAELKRESVSTLSSESDLGIVPTSETGVFGARGIALWKDASYRTSQGKLPRVSPNRAIDESGASSSRSPISEAASRPTDTKSTGLHVPQPAIRYYDSRETIRGQAIGTPADLFRSNQQKYYFERHDNRAERDNQTASANTDAVSPVSRPASTLLARPRPMSPSPDSEIGHLQTVPQNETRKLSDADYVHRPFIFNFRGASEESSLRPDDSASQRPRDSVQDSLSQWQRSSVQDSVSQIPHDSVQSSASRPPHSRISEVDSRPQSQGIHKDDTISEQTVAQLGHVTGPPPPSNINELPISVQKHYSRFGNQGTETQVTPSGEELGPELGDNKDHNINPRENTTEYQLPGVGPPEKSNPTPTKRRMSPFDKFRSRSRSRGRKLDDGDTDMPIPPTPQSEQLLVEQGSPAVQAEPKGVDSPTLKRKGRMSSPFSRLRGRSRPRNDVSSDDTAVPPLPQADEERKLHRNTTEASDPNTRESFFAIGKRRLSSPFRRLRSRSRSRPGMEIPPDDVPTMPLSNQVNRATSENFAGSAIVMGENQQLLRQRPTDIDDADALMTPALTELPSGAEKPTGEVTDRTLKQTRNLQEKSPKHRDRSLSWNRLRNKSLPRQTSNTVEVPSIETEKQSRSWGASLAGCFGTTEDEKPTLVARDSRQHLTNFSHEIPQPVTRLKSHTTSVRDAGPEDDTRMPNFTKLQSANSRLENQLPPAIEPQEFKVDFDDVKAGHQEDVKSRNTIRRRPTAAEKGKSTQRVELPAKSSVQDENHGSLIPPRSGEMKGQGHDEFSPNNSEMSREAQMKRPAVGRVSDKSTSADGKRTELAQLSTPSGLRDIRTIDLSEPLNFSPLTTSPTLSSRPASLHYRSPSIYSQSSQFQSLQRVQTGASEGIAAPTSPSSVRSSILQGQYRYRRESGSQPGSPILHGPYTPPPVPSLPDKLTSAPVERQLDNSKSSVRTGPYIPPLRTRVPSISSTNDQRQLATTSPVPPPRSPFRPPSISSTPRSSIHIESTSRPNTEDRSGDRSSWGFNRGESQRYSGLYSSSPNIAMSAPLSSNNRGVLHLDTSDRTSPSSEGVKDGRFKFGGSGAVRTFRGSGNNADETVLMSPTSYPGMEWRPAGLEHE